MTSRKTTSWATLATSLCALLVGSTAANGQKMYWTDTFTHKVQRANLDGSDVEDLVTSEADVSWPRGIALDLQTGKMYWTDSDQDRVSRADLDGSNVEVLVATGLEEPRGITLDLGEGKMYWTDRGIDKIQRAGLDGSNVEDLVTTGLIDPFEITLDLSAGKMYWVDGGTGKIQRADLDGSSIEDLVSGFGAPIGIDLDLSSGKMYWTDWGTSTIYRANLDGSNIVILVATGLYYPFGISLDPAAGKMYWTDSGTEKIQRANLDGSNIEDLVTANLLNPREIALDLTCPDGGPDCQPNGNPDACDIVRTISADCNGNGIPDECDIASGASEDCTGNFIPDECEPDCNANGVADSCDIADGVSEDCAGNGNGVPDECEPDCNYNGVVDSCDITHARGTDCNRNDVLDECDAGLGWDWPTIEFVPSGSTGPYAIICNEMTIPAGGVQVEFEILISGWGNATDNPTLGGYNVDLLQSSTLGANAIPVNPGVDLAFPTRVWCQQDVDCPVPSPPPVTQTGTCGILGRGLGTDKTCDDFEAGFIVALVCSDDLTKPCIMDDDCVPDAFCVDNPRFAMSGQNAVWIVSPWTGGTIQWVGVANSGGKVDDGVSRFHAGKLRLIVPADAAGRYAIRLDRATNSTYLTDPRVLRIQNVAIIDGQLTIASACCLPDASCAHLIESDCASVGGTPVEGELCDGDADGDGVEGPCGDGCPGDAGKLEPGQCGCGNPDDDTDADGVADCVDLCPDDSNKTEPGECGCGRDETGDIDGDGIPDCNDQCPGVDDANFAPDCLDQIPTASGWGLMAMTLLLLSAGKIYFGRRLVR